MKSFLYSVLETLEVVLVAFVTVFVIRNFLIQPFLVSGNSMEPSFSSGDYLLVDEVSYRFREPERGEVVVFRYKDNESTFYIKRIIGLPQERILINDEKIFIFNLEYPDGFNPKEKYIASSIKTLGNVDIALSENEYFVLGDNRYYSFDSRSWGPVQRAEIVGSARLRLWPINKVMAFDSPVY